MGKEKTKKELYIEVRKSREKLRSTGTSEFPGKTIEIVTSSNRTYQLVYNGVFVNFNQLLPRDGFHMLTSISVGEYELQNIIDMFTSMKRMLDVEDMKNFEEKEKK